jgi:glutamate-1-semialdehyde 2,1-aminomutase
VYAKALGAGSCAGLLRGRPVAPALRRFAAPRQILARPGSDRSSS